MISRSDPIDLNNSVPKVAIDQESDFPSNSPATTVRQGNPAAAVEGGGTHMQTNRSRWLRLLALLAAFTLLTAACGDDDSASDDSTSDDSASDDDSASGDDSAGDDDSAGEAHTKKEKKTVCVLEICRIDFLFATEAPKV